jgi:hypothetical protein
MTRRVEVIFTVKEYASEKPFLVMQTLRASDPMPEIERKVVGLDLRDGTTFEEAQALARELRQKITHFTLTD